MSDDTINLTRTEAAALIERVRVVLATAVREPDKAAQMVTLLELALASRRIPGVRTAIPPLVRCDGEAHGNAHIDNCGQCAPRWGWQGPKVRVR